MRNKKNLYNPDTFIEIMKAEGYTFNDDTTTSGYVTVKKEGATCTVYMAGQYVQVDYGNRNIKRLPTIKERVGEAIAKKLRQNNTDQKRKSQINVLTTAMKVCGIDTEYNRIYGPRMSIKGEAIPNCPESLQNASISVNLNDSNVATFSFSSLKDVSDMMFLQTFVTEFNDGLMVGSL